jgi:hypothetical protein
MPVLYVAVGRRLGYPLKLVTADSHLFVRWDGLDHANPAWRERFNIEGTNSGMSTHSDDYYKTWPIKTTDHQVRANRYLISLTPVEEFAQFLASRGHCASDNNRLPLAARCYENAYRYDSTRPCYQAWFTKAATRCGYRPSTPPLVRLLASRRRPMIGDDTFIHRTNRSSPPATPMRIPRPGSQQNPAIYGPSHPTAPNPAQSHIPQIQQTPQPGPLQQHRTPTIVQPPRSQ